MQKLHMNKREANREAKLMFCMFGEYYLSYCDEDWERYADQQDWTTKELTMVRDYYQRTCIRVADWLGV